MIMFDKSIEFAITLTICYIPFRNCIEGLITERHDQTIALCKLFKVLTSATTVDDND